MFMATKLTCLRSFPVVTGLRTLATRAPMRSSTLKTRPPLPQQPCRGFAARPENGFRQAARTRGRLHEETGLAPPATDVAAKVDGFGKMMVAGGAGVGLGALCYYGLGLSDEMGAVEKAAAVWPQHVKDRIHSTYAYLSGSLGLTALTAVAVSRSPALMGLMTRNSLLAIGTMFAAQVGATTLVRSISYEESPTAKHLAWALHAGMLGAVVAPCTLLGGPLLARAAWGTAGVVGSLSAVAMCAPSEKFLSLGGPLAVGLGVVFTSCLGSLFLSPVSALGAGVHSLALHGGLLVFGAAILYDTQKVIQRAEGAGPPLGGDQEFDPTVGRPYGGFQDDPIEGHPYVGVPIKARPHGRVQEFDPINESMSIYRDTVNIFVRLAAMLANDKAGKKR